MAILDKRYGFYLYWKFLRHTVIQLKNVQKIDLHIVLI